MTSCTALPRGKGSGLLRHVQPADEYLGESSTEWFEDTLGQRGLCAVSEGAGQKQSGLLLNGGVLIVHHTQNLLRQVLKSGLEKKRRHLKYDIM